MQSSNYLTFANAVYPFDRTVFIYNQNHKTLLDFFESIKDIKLFNPEETNARNKLLLDAMLHIHNYLSSQYSLLQILDVHANSLPIKNQLLSQFGKLKKAKVVDFINALRNNLIHQTHFGSTLRFESSWGRCKIVYAVSELLKSKKWGKANDYIAKHKHFVVIEDVIAEYHSHLMEFLIRFESTLYMSYASTFNDVLKTLLRFSEKYKAIGQKDILPVSDEYIAVKSNFYKKG